MDYLREIVTHRNVKCIQNFRILLNGAVNISGLNFGMVGVWWKNIFASKMYMNIIDRNKENDSYRPWNICPGYTGVTEGDRTIMLSKGDR